VLGVTTVSARHDGAATYHDSCSGLRELGVKTQPRPAPRQRRRPRAPRDGRQRRLLRLRGTFAVKYGDISNAIVTEKAKNIAESGAPMLLAGDLGCLLNMAGSFRAKAGQWRSATSPRFWPV
jgi:L-lactate dehydrogenase complex protein LldE